MVYCVTAGVLFTYPVATAIAVTVSVADTVIGPVYTLELVVGMAPLVV